MARKIAAKKEAAKARAGKNSFPPTPLSARLALKRKRKGKPPKNLKKCRLELYFGQKRAFPHFQIINLAFSHYIC
ncbi:MAG: hypothetical protein ABII95_00875 [Patescibacteria group bacterium]